MNFARQSKSDEYFWRPIVYPFGPKVIGVIVINKNPDVPKSLVFGRIDFVEFGDNKEYFEQLYQLNVLKAVEYYSPWHSSGFWLEKLVKLGPFYTERVQPEYIKAKNEEAAIKEALERALKTYKHRQIFTKLVKFHRG